MWYALLIPCIISLIAYYYFNHKITLQELLEEPISV